MKIEVNYAALESGNQQIQQISRALDEDLSALRGRLQRIEWEGDDRIAYQQHQDKWDKAVEGLNLVLNEIGLKIGEARQLYGATQARNVQRWGG